MPLTKYAVGPRTKKPVIAPKFELPPIERHSVLAETDAHEHNLLTGGGDDAVLRQAVSVQSYAARSLNILDDVRRNPNPRASLLSHASVVDKAAAGYAEQVRKHVHSARDLLTRNRDMVDSLIAQSLQPTPDAAELRAVLRSMDEPTRTKALEAAIHNRDRDLLAAAASGHPVAVGTTPEYHQSLKRRAGAALNPDLTSRRDRFQQALDLVDAVEDAAIRAAAAAVDGEAVKAFNEAAQAHEAAMQKLMST